MHGLGVDISLISKRIRFCNYLSVAQLYLVDNFLLSRPLAPADIKTRILGHWGTCPATNIIYASLKAHFKDLDFILGTGHGFVALQANLFYDGDLLNYYPDATPNLHGIEYLCKNFAWPYGFPSHPDPSTPGAITAGGELGYALGAAYGAVLGRPEKKVAVLLGDGEMETATALASLNLHRLLDSPEHGWVLPIVNLNGYKLSAPSVLGRNSEREILSLFRGFGFCPELVDGTDLEAFQLALSKVNHHTILLVKTPKGYTGPRQFNDYKIADNFRAHQIPLADAKTNPEALKALEDWLLSYRFKEVYDEFTQSRA